MRKPRRLLLLPLFALAIATIANHPHGVDAQDRNARGSGNSGEGTAWVWWEGEDCQDTNFNRQNWLSGNQIENARLLSGDDWLTSDGPRGADEMYARFEVNVPSNGTWQLWTRKFWKHGPFRWRFGNDEWTECGRDCALADTVELRQHVCANWVSLGEVELRRGTQTFEIRLLVGQGENTTSCFDAFLITKRPFVPRGKLKPGARTGLAEEGYWAFEPGWDEFEDCDIDLRYLNEKEAGEKGHVKAKDGHFVLGNGEKARFWAVNAGPGIIGLDKASISYLARRLAKLGVNMVRYHGAMFDASGGDPARINAERLDQLHWFVAAMKKEGVYVKLSFYFPLWFDIRPGYGIDGYDTIQNKRPFALLYFNQRMQQIYRAWAKEMLTAENPYTKTPLADEPAVAIVEILNEDSFLFWTFNRDNVPANHWAALERKFGEWAAKKHGSAGAALSAWGGGRLENDDPGSGRLHLYNIWDLTGDGVNSGGSRARKSDQLRFLVETQRGFYEEIADYFRKECKLKSLISCSNWHTADARVMDALERHTYTAGDVIDKHGYFGGRHEGDRSSYAVSVGDRYTSRSGLTDPRNLPIQFNRLEGYPHIISEIGWPDPNDYKAEFPVLAAAYGSLQDVDGFYFFALNSAHWNTSPEKFPVNVPSIMAQFPACALMYRRGDLKVGDEVVHDALKLDELYDFRGGAVSASANLDELRQRDVGGAGDTVDSIDPRAFYVGRVTRSIDDRRRSDKVANLSKYIDNDAGTITSESGELVWNHERGYVSINSKKVQGAVGFLGRLNRVELDDIEIRCGNEYAAVLVIALDDKPLSASKKLLVQVMTDETFYGWRTQGDRITALGGYPMNVRNAEVTITLTGTNRRLKKWTVLDENGYERDKGTLRGNKPELELPADAIWTIIEQ